jgi:hypothetical protein
MFGKLAARDFTIVASAAALWWLLAGSSAGDGLLADLSGFVAGVGFGASAYLIHEWGHIAGAVASGGIVHPGPGLHSPSVFRFDTEHSSRAQFLWMSLGGFVATGGLLCSAYVLLPDGLLATRLARGIVAFLAMLGVVLELPLVLYSLVTGKLPPLERTPSPEVGAPVD